ncbi:helix-turn-helix domain-containing protein [Candidatus Nephthysia bennettiae]|uniref:Helix-turn-helix domain-containing protein n=1 Tax=Candidatus Nephthysia bennettiae TaxID=3127016 RepID=A0A934K4A9_9BACT|nr:helix-turn-helix domain-containing protein [Candidatus Dormibacteraeota bacterium]
MTANERLRSTLTASAYTQQQLAEEVGIDPKTVERWVTKGRVPHRRTAMRTARLLGVSASWLWPDLDKDRSPASHSEVVAYYPHRSEVPKRLWMDVLESAEEQIGLLAYASLFLPEENPEAIDVLRLKATRGVQVRIALGDPDSAEAELRGREERLYEAIPARIRMALTYYRPLVDVPGVEFHLHRTTLYNSIFRYDDEMLINTHVYGNGYIAPILHLRRVEGGTLFDMYARSFERVWVESYPIGQQQAGRVVPASAAAKQLI